MNGDLTIEQAKDITTNLKAEVDWILRHEHYTLNPNISPIHQGDKFKSSESDCGTCLVGAYLIHRQPPRSTTCTSYVDSTVAVETFAEVLRIPLAAAKGIYFGAVESLDHAARVPRATKVSVDVLKYALSQGWDSSTYFDDDDDGTYAQLLTEYEKYIAREYHEHGYDWDAEA